MTWVATAVVVGSTVGTTYMQRRNQRKAEKRANRQALTDEQRAINMENFQEEEGKGQGMFGEVQLGAPDDEVETELDAKRRRSRELQI